MKRRESLRPPSRQSRFRALGLGFWVWGLQVYGFRDFRVRGLGFAVIIARTEVSTDFGTISRSLPLECPCKQVVLQKTP